MDEVYSQGQIEAILNDVGVDVKGETDTNLLCLCPFHRNTDSPSLSIDKDKGLYLCFSPMCDERGTLVKLVTYMTNSNPFVVKRIIDRHRTPSGPISEQIEDLLAKKIELPSFNVDTMNRMADDLWGSIGQDYMVEQRKFKPETLGYFGIGYSIRNDMIAIPLHDWDANLVGIIGRSRVGKVFKNSDKLPTSKLLFNAHRAKKIGDKVVVVESSMDAMRVHQAGFPNVVATNGGFFTEWHKQTLDRYFNTIIIMTDMDDPDKHRSPYCKKCTNTCLGHNPGRALGEKIIKSLPTKRIRWASFDHHIVYPDGAKDAGDMTDEQIAQCIDNSITSIEWAFWKKENKLFSLV